MGKITDITLQRSGKRVNIFVDGSFRCGLERITALQAGLAVGMETDDAALEALQLDSEKETAFNKAISFVSSRRRTEMEIRRKLREKGYMPGVISAVISKLRDYGYVNDAQFAHDYVEAYKDRAGGMKIRAELRRLGISDKLADEALRELSADDALESAMNCARRYLAARDFDRQKLYRHLASKGYSFDIVREAVNRAAQEEE